MRRVLAGVVVAMSAARADAQEPARFSLDSVIGIDVFQGQSTVDDPNIVVDITAVLRLSDGWLAYVRPWLREPRLPRPGRPENWDKEIYQAAVQYERPGRVSVRAEGGYIASPIGLGLMDSRPGVNPTIATHLSYVQPMPVFDSGAPRVSPISSSYPLGAQVTLSTARWDGRAALVNSAPTRSYELGSSDNPAATPVFVTGGGLTPVTGLRLGVAYSSGLYVTGSELAVPQVEGRGFRMVNLEGEFAFGYTKLSGEITQTRFAAAAGPAVARSWFVQGIHTLSPRWFVAGRQEGVAAPPLRTATTVGPRRMMYTAEATVGYRLTRDLTLRGSLMSRKAYTRTEWDQQAGASLVWARRWW